MVDRKPLVSIGMPVYNGESKPLITTIIPTYRRPKLLRRAIKSVLNQTYPFFQVCVYDNASGDETSEVVAAFSKKDPRVRYHCHSENIGGINNFIYGMERVKTPFYSFLADDDFLLPNFYKTAMSVLKTHETAIFFSGSTIIIRNGKIVSINNPILLNKGLCKPPEGLYLLFRYHITWTSILFRTNIISEVGFLYPDSGIWVEQDYEFRISRKLPYYYSEEPVTVFVEHSEYEHWKDYYRNWSTLMMLGGRHLSSEEMNNKMRLQFLKWFLKPLRWLTIQTAKIFANKGEQNIKLISETIHILKSHRVPLFYMYIIKFYVYALLLLNPLIPLLKFLKSTLEHILSFVSFTKTSSISNSHKKYDAMIKDVLCKLEDDLSAE